ncbi:hypothetical protein J6590_025523, partial [Homalodisca vitripennis]
QAAAMLESSKPVSTYRLITYQWSSLRRCNYPQLAGDITLRGLCDEDLVGNKRKIDRGNS